MVKDGIEVEETRGQVSRVVVGIWLTPLVVLMQVKVSISSTCVDVEQPVEVPSSGTNPDEDAQQLTCSLGR